MFWLVIPYWPLTTRPISLCTWDISKGPEAYGSYWLAKTLLEASWKQTIWNDMTLTDDQRSFAGIRTRSNVQTSGGPNFSCSPEGASRSWAIKPTVGEVLEWLERFTFILNSQAVSRLWNGCMLQREDGRWGNWENGSRHWMPTLCIAPFERDFIAIPTP